MIEITNIIKQIRKIMGEHWSSELSIKYYTDDEVIFYIYESEVPIVVSLKDKEVFLDTEPIDNRITSDMLKELSGICKLLEDNISVVIETYYGEQE